MISPIPHPDIDQVIVSGELFFLLYPLRIMARVIESEASKEHKELRKILIKRHVKLHNGHKWKHCKVDSCASLAVTTVIDSGDLQGH